MKIVIAILVIVACGIISDRILRNEDKEVRAWFGIALTCIILATVAVYIMGVASSS